MSFPESVRRRLVAVLFVTQSFFTASIIASFTLSPIIAAALSGRDGAAGLPNTLGYMMDRFGRRLALTTGYSTAVLGGIVSVWGIIGNSFLLFLLGALLLGMARSAGDQTRYVGAEVYPLVRRARVIGILVFAGTFGAIVGPLLVPLSTEWLANGRIPADAGPFLISSVLMVIGTAILFFFLRPDPQQVGQAVAAEEAAADPESIENLVREKRPLRQIFGAPLVQLAIIAMVVSYFVMVFLMVITPLHMDHFGHNTTAISNIIMAHTLGMFGFSWLTGYLIDRIGRIPMILASAAVLIVSCVLAPLSLELPILGLSLFLLGLGWNFGFVAGSSLLSDALAADERGRGQGASEALVALGAGSASLVVGLIFEQGGYLLVSGIGLVVSVSLVFATVVLARKARLQQAQLATRPLD